MKRNYTPEEVFWTFKEEHRLCSPLDLMADPNFELRFDSTIWEWRCCRDLLEWEELSDFFNQMFRISISRSEWRKVFNPEDKRTIGDVCFLISRHATKEEAEPVKLLGKKCLSASVFLMLKKNLKNKGVDVSELKPSSKVSPYLDKFFSPVVEEITLTGSMVFEKLEYKRIRHERIIKNLWDKVFPRYKVTGEFNTGEAATFRDVVNKIIENKRNTLDSDC